MKSGGEAFRETVLGEKAKEGREDWFRALGTPAVVSRQKGEESKHLKHSGRKVKGEPRSAMAEGKRKTISEWLPRHLGWRLHKGRKAKTCTSFGNMGTNILTCGCKSWIGVVWRVREIERENVTILSKVWLL